MKPGADVVASLRACIKHSKSQIPGQMGKKYYGDKLKKLAEQYRKWVVRQYVPDNYELSTTGATQRVNTPLTAEN